MSTVWRLRSVFALCVVALAVVSLFVILVAAAQGEQSALAIQAAPPVPDGLASRAGGGVPDSRPAGAAGGTIGLSVTHGSGVQAAPCRDPLTPTLGFPCVWLPVIFRDWPPLPAVPILHAPDNSDGDGNYTVIWDPVAHAETYQLQQAVYADFRGVALVYSGPGTTYVASGRGAARYYYRVKAHNSRGDSAWSTVRYVDVLWEAEPNNDPLTQANGPIVSGNSYYGRLPDEADFKDYFFFELPADWTVELWLANIPAGNNYDLVLRNSKLEIVAQSVNPGNAYEYIHTEALPRGTYYVQIVRVAGPGSQQPYYLSVVY